MPLFTVVISTYNRKHVLPRAVSSVLGQTFGDFELIVVDNGSTDGTGAVVTAIKDPRIKYVRNPSPTSSCDGPRNMGIEMARGAYIAFLDDDDIWYPKRLERVKEAFERNPEVSAVCHNENRNYKGKVDKLLEYGPWSEDIFERLLYEGNRLSSCATTIKKEVFDKLGGFDLRKEFAAAADYDYWLRLTGSGAKIFFLKEPLGEFGYTGENWSLKDPGFQSRIAFLIKEHILKYENKPLAKISDRGMLRLLKLYLISTKFLIRAFRFMDAIKCLLAAGYFLILRPRLIFKIFSRNGGK